MKFSSFLIALVCLQFLISCQKEEKVESVKFGLKVPAHFPEPLYKFENNKQFESRFKLGRDLFYDPILSLDNTISCASCHSQTHGFADHNGAFSSGVGGTLGTRNSPSITNLAWYPSFMWDGGVNHIELFSIAPITNPLEMKESIVNVLAKLNANEAYREKFRKAYNATTITDQKLFQALSQYMAMIVSANSKYDQYRAGETTLSAGELEGLSLFQAKCASCHTEPLFTNFNFENNGLDATFTDLGRGHITQNPNDNGKFKVPSLRNVELTYPYMHDGRFFTLGQVMDHYTAGIQDSPTLSTGLAGGIPMTAPEKQKIILFLKTLTDYSLMADPLLSEPVN
jgi:cytochrome c peroxidase